MKPICIWLRPLFGIHFILNLGVTLELSVPSLTADVYVSCMYATRSAMMSQTGSSVGTFKCFSGALLVYGDFLAMTKHLTGTLWEEGLFLGHSCRIQPSLLGKVCGRSGRQLVTWHPQVGTKDKDDNAQDPSPWDGSLCLTLPCLETPLHAQRRVFLVAGPIHLTVS